MHKSQPHTKLFFDGHLQASRLLEDAHQIQLVRGVDLSSNACYYTARYTMIPEKSSKERMVLHGVVTEALPDTLFKVRLEDKTELLSYLAGKMRINRIRVLIGDKVMVEIDPYGGKGRIVKRL